MINTENRTLQKILWAAFIIYLLILTKFILFKWSFAYTKDHFVHNYNWDFAKQKLHHLDLIPLASIRGYLFNKADYADPIFNLLGNIIGFIPLGILLPLIFRKLRSFKSTLLRVFLISLCFELTQLLMLLGQFDVDDLMLNTLGGAIGYGLFYMLNNRRLIA